MNQCGLSPNHLVITCRGILLSGIEWRYNLLTRRLRFLLPSDTVLISCLRWTQFGSLQKETTTAPAVASLSSTLSAMKVSVALLLLVLGVLISFATINEGKKIVKKSAPKEVKSVKQPEKVKKVEGNQKEPEKKVKRVVLKAKETPVEPIYKRKERKPESFAPKDVPVVVKVKRSAPEPQRPTRCFLETTSETEYVATEKVSPVQLTFSRPSPPCEVVAAELRLAEARRVAKEKLRKDKLRRRCELLRLEDEAEAEQERVEISIDETSNTPVAAEDQPGQDSSEQQPVEEEKKEVAHGENF